MQIKRSCQVQGCRVQIYEDHAAACRAVAEEIARGLAAREHYVLNIAGGSTILGVWDSLVKSELDLRRAEIFWGDEHITEPQSKQNNFALAWPYVRELIERGVLLPQKVHRIPTWNPREQRPFTYEEAQLAAQAYAAEIEAAGEQFDLSIIGLGSDFHTASLLPGVPREVLESDRLVEAVAYSSDLRITLTPKAFKRSDRVIMLLTGQKKAPALWEILTQEIDLQRRPGQLIRLLPNTLIITDREAAALLLEEGLC